MTQQDIDLQKIQTLESSYQGWFNLKASLVTGAIVGISILIATTQYEQILPFYSVPISFLILIVVGYWMVADLKKAHEEHISYINQLMLRVEKKEKLESIEELNREKITARLKLNRSNNAQEDN